MWFWVEARGGVVVAWPGVGEASVPYGSDVRNPDLGKEASVDEYELEALAASAEAVVPGLGPLAVMLARLADTASGPQSLDVMVAGVVAEARELLRGVVQLGVDGLARPEVRGMTGSDGAADAGGGGTGAVGGDGAGAGGGEADRVPGPQ
jgi:hypothetical protein